MEGQQIIVKSSPVVGLSILNFLWKNKFWIILILFLLPTIMSSIKMAIETSNPTLPFFQLSTRIFTADIQIQKDVELLKQDPTLIIGLPHPEEGIWRIVVYYWHFFINVIWKMFGNIWLTFLPLLIIYKVMTPRETGQAYRNLLMSIGIFIAYLFVTNTIIMLHGVITGKMQVTMPQGLGTMKEYFYLFTLTLPFHGIFQLIMFLINTAVR
jgi:hypothetical protein